jgi:hypothetical protein
MADEEKISNDFEIDKELIKAMSRSILPIVAKTDTGKMKGVGSCTLLTVNNINYIVTAAHVLRDWGGYQLYLSIENKAIEITWPFIMTKKGDKKCDYTFNADYTLDVAFFPIIPELQDLLSEDHDAISLDGFNKDTISYDQEVLFAFGYPTSKIGFDKHNKIFNVVPLQYFGKEIDDLNLYKKSCSYIDDHLLVNFVKRKTKNPSRKNYVIAPDTKGLSGGGLFRVLLKDGHPELFILEGILTEWHRDLSLLKSARSKKVREAIIENTQ